MSGPTRATWTLLPSMELHENAGRQDDGSVTISRWKGSVAFLHGPHLRLRQGHYRLGFHGSASNVRHRSHPVVEVEIIAQNRFHRGWRDFTAAELELGEASIEFEVPPELDGVAVVDASFEFRFRNLLNADLTISAIALHDVTSLAGSTEPVFVSRLIGYFRPAWVATERLHFLWLALRRQESMRFSHFAPGRPPPWLAHPRIQLPSGLYRVELGGLVTDRECSGRPALRVIISTRSDIILASHDFAARDFPHKRAWFDFEVPAEVGAENGENPQLQFKIWPYPQARVTLDAIDLRRVSPAVAAAAALAPRPSAMAIIQPARRRLLFIGNCQAGLLAETFRCDDVLANSFRAKHHFVELPSTQWEQGKRDLQECDMILLQDINMWSGYPLRSHVSDAVPLIRFPCLRFASLWPFDSCNGPDDGEARRRDFPNFEFTHFDGLLGRLRKEIPDRATRFAAYCALEIDGVIDARRLHQFEERRLGQMDAKFGGAIGAYTLENFRRRRLFHTTGHPDGELLAMLLRQITDAVGIKRRVRQSRPLSELGHLQVPVHPKVARALGVGWADEATEYRYRGHRLTWEAYIKRYIAYYG